MSINCDYTELIKDKNVRVIFQKIRDELKVSKADKPHVLAKVPSFTGKVELFNQNTTEENDEYFIRCLSDNKIIINIKFEVRYPNKNKGDIDYSLLNTPEEFKTPYVTVSFDVLDKQFLDKLYKEAIDALVVNPYPAETQQNLENEIATIENQSGFNIDVISEVLNLTKNIYETYTRANFEAKKHYLSIFFERIEVKDKAISKVTYTQLFNHLREAEKVRVTPNWLPLKDLFCNHKLEFDISLSEIKIVFDNLELQHLQPVYSTG